MPLDEVTRRLVFVLQHDVRRLVEGERARAARSEDVRYDAITRMATWETRRGEVIGRWYGEVVASYVVRDRILRWAWAGRASISTLTHSEIVAREGQARGVPQLSMSVVGDLDEEEASTLARLGVLVSRGVGLKARDDGDEITFIGLFDSPRPREGDPPEPSRYSVPPPAVAPRSSPPAPRPPSSPPSARASLPPIREIYGPRSSPRSFPPRASQPDFEIREPARSIFLPVATGVLQALARTVPGFKQGLFVIGVEPPDFSSGANAKHRLTILLVASDGAGQLVALDPSRELAEATARMVETDQLDGNGPWRKLSARITPKPDGGATLHVDVL